MEHVPGRKAGPSSPETPGGLGISDLTRRSFFAHTAAVAGTVALSGLGAVPAMAASGRNVETVISPKVIPNVRVAITDSYGTVFNITTALITALRPFVPKAEDFAKMWLTQVLAWTETVAAMGPHAYFEFWELVGRAGRWVAEERNVKISDEQWDKIMSAWRTPQPFEDAEAFFTMLDKAGIPTAILSNGSPAMLHAAADAAGWLPKLETIISVDQAHTYKSSPQAYLLAHDVFRVPKQGDILFISGHQWDVAGAGAAGLRTVYLNRDNQPMWYLKSDYVDYVFNSMVELAEAILRARDAAGPG